MPRNVEFKNTFSTEDWQFLFRDTPKHNDNTDNDDDEDEDEDEDEDDDDDDDDDYLEEP